MAALLTITLWLGGLRKTPKKLLTSQGSFGILGFRNFVNEVNKIEKFWWENISFMYKLRSSCVARLRIRNYTEPLVVGSAGRRVAIGLNCGSLLKLALPPSLQTQTSLFVFLMAQ